MTLKPTYALAIVDQSVGRCTVHWKIAAGSAPFQGICLGVGSIPGRGVQEVANGCSAHSEVLSLSLQKVNKIFLKTTYFPVIKKFIYSVILMWKGEYTTYLRIMHFLITYL